MASAVSGVSGAGFSTTVQPAASAGPILRVAIAAGKFHGVTNTATPIGWRSTRMRLAPPGAVDIERIVDGGAGHAGQHRLGGGIGDVKGGAMRR
jgi:hypothetical protein